MSVEKQNLFERSIQKWGNSYAVRIPKSIIDSANINPETDKIFLSVDEDENIQIRKEKPEYREDSIQHLFQNYKGGSFESELMNPEYPVGDEEW